MCYENEFCIDQWHHVDDHKEEFGTTSFKEFDGTEREDGGDRCEVFNLEDFCDTADRDRYENEMAQYDAVLETMDTDLAECSSEAEELATVSRLTKHFLGLGYFAYIVNEAAADATIYHHQQQNTPN